MLTISVQHTYDCSIYLKFDMFDIYDSMIEFTNFVLYKKLLSELNIKEKYIQIWDEIYSVRTILTLRM